MFVRHQPKETSSVTPQKFIVLIMGTFLFAMSLRFIAEFSGLSCSTNYFNTTPQKYFDKGPSQTLSRQTHVLFPWRSSVETLPVSAEEPLNITYDVEYSLNLFEMTNTKSGKQELLVTVHQLDPEEDEPISRHLGILLHCHSGEQWIQWLEGDHSENFPQANNRAQQACEEAAPVQ